jgi:RHS repeat-associated protein
MKARKHLNRVPGRSGNATGGGGNKKWTSTLWLAGLWIVAMAFVLQPLAMRAVTVYMFNPWPTIDDYWCGPPASTAASCPNCGAGSGPGAGHGGRPGSPGRGGGVTSTGNCGTTGCMGMAVWEVSEPLLNLWVLDTPLVYQPSRGPVVEFSLQYKNDRELVETNDQSVAHVFSVGRNWDTPWRCFLRQDPNNQNRFVFINGVGGATTITNDGTVEYRTRLTCTNQTVQGQSVPVILYANGAQDVFGCPYDDGSSIRYFLTQRSDEAGNALTFSYVTNTALCLTNVADADGKNTTFVYTNINGYQLIAEVDSDSSFGRSAVLVYDSTHTPPDLVTITDAVQMASSMVYDSSGKLTQLITPYGTNRFTLVTKITSGSLEKALQITEADSRSSLYLYADTTDSTKLTNSYSGYRPSTSNAAVFAFANTFDSESSNGHNSFYWGPRQYQYLGDFTNALANGTLDTTNLYSTNYLLAWQRHWLTMGTGQVALWNTLSLEREPSPDGATQGMITWYDYDGKPAGHPEQRGTNSLPRFEARSLPSGQASFIYYQRNTLGYATNTISTYNNPAGDLLVRTNVALFAGNQIDLLAVTNAGVLLASNIFNTAHQVATNFDGLLQPTVYTYDANHLLTCLQRPSGLFTTNLYDTSGWRTSSIDYEVVNGSPVYYATNNYTYTNGLVYTRTDPLGLSVTNVWDNLNRLRRTTYPDGTFVTNTYDKLDLVQVVDRMRLTNSASYDALRRKTGETNALGFPTAYHYCPCGALGYMQDAFGSNTLYSYDLAGQRTAIGYPDSYTVQYQYDLMGQVTNVTVSGGASTTNWYNNQGLLYAVSNAYGRVQAAAYDPLDRATNSIDANGVTMSSTYDDLGRLLTRTYPDTGVERFGYSARGLTAYTNQLSLTNYFGYDAAGRRTFETNANGEWTQFRYDPAGNLTNLIDGNSHSTIWKYDVYGRVTNKTDNLGTNLFTYVYDADGRLTNRTSAEKGTTVYKYDGAGNLTNIVYPVSTNITLQYDPLNRLTNMVDAAGTTRYTYDAAGQVLSEDGPWDNDTVSVTYNNRLRTALALGGSWSVSYGYDAARRLTNVVSPAGTFSYAYDPVANGQWKKLTLPGGAYVTNAYDSVARLLSTSLKSSSDTVLNAHQYGYNPANQRTQQVFMAGNYVNYTYDASGQLQTAVGWETNGATRRLNEQFGYAYDKAGNLGYRTNNALVQAFGVNSLNELTTNSRSGTLTVAGAASEPKGGYTLWGVPAGVTNVTVSGTGLSNGVAELYLDGTFARTNATLGDGNNSYTAVAQDTYGRQATNSITVNLPATNWFVYDVNGNLRTNDARIFDYDDENQLIRVTQPGAWKSEFSYDGKMRLRVRYESTWNGSTWVTNAIIRYVYDGNLVIQERDSNNVAQVAYTRGKDLSGSFEGAGGIGGLLARTDNGLLAVGSGQAHAYYHADGNGNITALINTNQALVAKYLYGPFGEVIRKTGAMGNACPLRFSTKYQDDETDLVYYGRRYYSAGTGRWLNRDPLGSSRKRIAGKGWLREQADLYHFTFNDPLNRQDALGLAVNDVQVASIQCPKTCGPDYTAAVNKEIAALRTYMYGAPETPTPIGDSLLFDGLNAAILLSWFKNVAGSLNYFDQAEQAAQGQNPFTGCPSGGCSGTITLCGKCVGSDVPGNIMFGFMSTAAGLPDWMRRRGADYAEAGDGDGEGDIWPGGKIGGAIGAVVGIVIPVDKDQDVFPLGDSLFRSGSTDICSVLGKLPSHGKSSCKPCPNKTGTYNPQFPFQRIPYPAYY